MQRVSSARSYLRSAVPGNIRKNSTQSTPTPEPAAPKKPAKLTLKGWDDIILPSREEVLAQRKAAEEKAKAKAQATLGLSKSKTDIGYLKFESNKSLAARLAKPMIEIQEKMLQEKLAKAKAEEKPKSDPTQPIKLALSPAEQRRAVRLAREAEIEKRNKQQAEQEEQRRIKEEEIRVKEEERREERRVRVAKAVLSQTERQLQNLNMVAQNLMTSTLPHHAPPPLSEKMKLAKESAAKRREERLSRQAGASQSGADRNRVQALHKRKDSRPKKAYPKKASGERGVNRRTKKQPEEDTFEELVALDGTPSYLPELTGPPAYSLDLTPIRQPTLVAPTSQYVPNSLSFTTKRVDNLYPPTQLVQMVLSHRVDVSIRKRMHALALVSSMTKSSSLSKVVN